MDRALVYGSDNLRVLTRIYILFVLYSNQESIHTVPFLLTFCIGHWFESFLCFRW